MPERINFDRAVDYYDRTRGFPAGVERDVAAFIAREGVLNGDSQLLEIGVGTGRVALPLAEHAGRIYGADISTGMMGELLRKWSGEAVYPVQADARQLPYPDGTFDAALVVHVFHLIGDVENAVRELARVLKPGGLLLHGGNTYDSGLEKLSQAWEAAHPAFARTARKRGRDANELIAEMGWQQVGEVRSYAFTQIRTPASFIENIEQQQWSSTWDMPDEEIEQGLQAVYAAVVEHFGGDLQAPIHVAARFTLTIFRRPDAP